ncbi:alpha/beta hydrolase [Desulfobacterales bacterium HSG16]|nr:alpha/beta hydrolase [Desulfobacterales bacterium HSG16]
MEKKVSYHPETIIRAGKIKIAQDSFGNPDAPPLILVAGLGFQMIMYDEVFCRTLASRGFWVIRFDNRDTGRSERINVRLKNVARLIRDAVDGKKVDVPYTLFDMADDVAGLMDALKIKSAHIAGCSMGGRICQIMGIRHQKRIRTITSIMSTTGDPKLPPPTPEAMTVLYRTLPDRREGYIDTFVRNWEDLGGVGEASDKEINYVRKMAEKSFDRGYDPAGVARQMAAIAAAGNIRPLLDSVKSPTLVIHGEADPLLPKECGVDTANAIPGAELLIIKAMGHTLPEHLWPRIIDAICEHVEPYKFA